MQKNISAVKINAAMRSLYRFSELKSHLSPDIIIDNEKTVLTNYLAQLNSDEILFIAQNFNQYCKNQRTQDEVDDQKIMDGFNLYIQNVN